MTQVNIEAKKEVLESLPNWMAKTHIKINSICSDYYAKMRRKVFVTPKSYLTFIRSYQRLYKTKFDDLTEAEQNYKIGLQKIADTKSDIQKMEVILKGEEEKVQKMKEQVEKIIKQLNVEREKANKKNKEVKRDKSKIEIEKKKIEITKETCEKELALSLPALIKAQKSASQISAKEISGLKPVFSKETHVIMKYIGDAIQIVLYQKVRNDIIMVEKPLQASKKDPNSKFNFFYDSWEMYGKSAFFHPSLTEKMKMMAKTENENLINGEILELLEPYTRNKNSWLSLKYAVNVFKQMNLIHDWVLQIEKFSIETKNIKPKRLALKQALNKLNEASKKLEKAENQLKLIEEKCAKLDETYKVNND